MSESIPGDHAYSVKYSVTADIEEALRKFAELKAALEELKRSGGSFDIGSGGSSNLSGAIAAQQSLRQNVDQTSASLAREATAHDNLSKATQSDTQSALSAYQAREQALKQSKAQTDALAQEAAATRSKSDQVTQAVQKELVAKQAEVKANQDVAKAISDVTKATAEQDRQFRAQASSGTGNAGVTALAQFEARRKAEEAARQATTAGTGGELIQAGSTASLKRFLADELKRQQQGAGGFNATSFADMAFRATSAQNSFSTLSDAIDLSYKDIDKITSLDKALVKFQKDFVGNTDAGIWAKNLRQNLADLAEVSFGVSQNLDENMQAVRREMDTTVKLSDILAHQSFSETANKLEDLRNRIADPQTKTAFKDIISELTSLDTAMAKSSKSAAGSGNSGLARNFDDGRKSLAEYATAVYSVRNALDDQARSLDKVAKRGTDGPFLMKGNFLSLGGVLKDVGRSVDDLGYRFIDLGTKMRGAGGGGGFFNTLLGAAGDASGFFSQLVGGSVRAVGAIAPFVAQLLTLTAILPAVIALVGALGAGIIGVAGAIAPVVGTLAFLLPIVVAVGIAFGTLLAAVKPVMTAMQNLGSTNAKTAANALKGLSPAAATAAKDLEALKKAFSGANIEQPFWLGADKGLKSLLGAASPVKTLLTGMAKELGNLTGTGLDKFAQVLKSSDFKTVLAPGAVTIVGNLGNAFISLLGALTKIAVVATPFATILTGNIASGLKKIDDFVTKQSGNQGLAWFFGDAYVTAKKLGDILGDAFGGLFSLMKQFRPLGDSFLSFLDKSLDKFDKWAKNTDFTGFLKNSQMLLSGVGKVLGDIIGGIAKLGNNGNSIKFFVGLLSDLNTVLPPAFTLLGKILNLLSLGLKPVGDALHLASQWLADILNWVSKMIDKIESNPTGLKVLQGIFGALGTLVVGASVLAAFDKLIKIGGMAWDKLGGSLKSVFNALFGTSFGKGTGADPTGLGAAGDVFSAKLTAAFDKGATTLSAAITDALRTGGATAATEIRTAETEGGAVAGVEMAGAESGGGFIGGFSGWLKGGGFSKLLGGAIIGGLTAQTLSSALGTKPVGNTNNPQQAIGQAFSDISGGAAGGARVAGPPGAAVGAVLGLMTAVVSDPQFRKIQALSYANAPITPVRTTRNGNTTDRLSSASTQQLLGAQTTYPNKSTGVNPYTTGIPPISQQHASLIPAPQLTQQQMLNLLYSDQVRNNLPNAFIPGHGTGIGTKDSGFHPLTPAITPGKATASSTTVKGSIYFPNVMTDFNKNVVQPLTKALTNLKASIYWPNIMTSFNKLVKSPIEQGLTNFKASLYWPNVMTSFNKLVKGPIEQGLTNFKASLYWPNVMGNFTKTVKDPIEAGLTNFKASLYWPNVLATFNKTVRGPIEAGLTNFKASLYWPNIMSTFNKTVHDPIQAGLTNFKASLYFPNIMTWFFANVVAPMTKALTNIKINATGWFSGVMGIFTALVEVPISTYFAKTLPGQIKGSISSWFTGIAPAMTAAFKGAINASIGLLNQAVSSINSVIGAVPGAPKMSPVRYLSEGGMLPGSGDTDSLDIKAMPGEFMIRKKAASALGANILHRLNQADRVPVNRNALQHLASGGFVASDASQLLSNASAGMSPNLSPFLANIMGHGVQMTRGQLGKAFSSSWGSFVDPRFLSSFGQDGAPEHTAYAGALGAKMAALLGLNRDDSLVSQANSKAAAVLKSFSGGAIPTAAHKAIMDAALKAAGVPQSQWGIWEAGLNTLITRESGWNPAAVNLCVTLDTMILTKRGYLKYSEVTAGDQTLGLNPETECTEWTTITDVHYYNEAPVVSVGNSRWHATVTPNHKWVTQRRTTVVKDIPESCHLCEWPSAPELPAPLPECPECGWMPKAPGGVALHRSRQHGVKGGANRKATQRRADIKRYNSPGGLPTHLSKIHGISPESQETTLSPVGLKATDALDARDILLLAAVADTDSSLDISTEEARLLGWIAGDGHVEKLSALPRGRKRPSMSVAQSKPAMVAKLQELMKNFPHAEYVSNKELKTRLGNTACGPTHAFRLDPSYAEDLIERVGHPKLDAFDIVMKMSTEQRLAWLDAMIDAEGHRDVTTNHVKITQCYGPVLDAIELASYMCGYRPRVISTKIDFEENPNWRPSANVTLSVPRTHVAALTIQEVDSQPVWCVTTELGTWTARLDDQVFLTGNSDSNAKAGHPSQGLAQTIPGTFSAYHVPGTSNNILDPVANVAAAIRYIMSTYHGIQNVQQANASAPPKGYALGGFVTPDFGIGSATQSLFSHRPAGVSSSSLSSGAKALADGSGVRGNGLYIGEMNVHNPLPQQTSETLSRTNARLRVFSGRG